MTDPQSKTGARTPVTDSIDIKDPRLRSLMHRLSKHPANGAEPKPREGHTQAAVALVVRASDDLELLLIERAKSVRDPWSGHVALPGGRRDPGDAILEETAIRETSEETGVELATRGLQLGRLTEVLPSSERLPPITVVPYVFAVPPDVDARVNSREVQSVLWVSIETLLDPRSGRTITIDLPEGPRKFPSYHVRGHTIWGLTFRILTEFLTMAETP